MMNVFDTIKTTDENNSQTSTQNCQYLDGASIQDKRKKREADGVRL